MTTNKIDMKTRYQRYFNMEEMSIKDLSIKVIEMYDLYSGLKKSNTAIISKIAKKLNIEENTVLLILEQQQY